jgi:hypothetical protein
MLILAIIIMILKTLKLSAPLRNSSQETIDFPIHIIMKNFGKIPNHISIRDEKGAYKRHKKSRKKSNSGKKNIGSTGTSKLITQPKSRQVIFI